jgi:hypothetical protein
VLVRRGIGDANDRSVARIDTTGASEVEIMRGDLVALLHQATGQGVKYVFGDSIRQLEQDNDGVTVSFDHGRPGASMTWDVPDRTEDHYPQGECTCGRDLADAEDLGVIRSYQQEEIPASPAERVQHDLHKALCCQLTRPVHWSCRLCWPVRDPCGGRTDDRCRYRDGRCCGWAVRGGVPGGRPGHG